jgi:hypothetical protein
MNRRNRNLVVGLDNLDLSAGAASLIGSAAGAAVVRYFER